MATNVTEIRSDAVVAHLQGRFGPSDVRERLARRVSSVRRDLPLVVDLAGLADLDDPRVRMFVLALDRALSHRATAVLHDDESTRRMLRGWGLRMPVVPDLDHALHQLLARSSGRRAHMAVTPSGRTSGAPTGRDRPSATLVERGGGRPSRRS